MRKGWLLCPLSESIVNRGQSLLTQAFIEQIDGREFLRNQALLLVPKMLQEDVVNVIVSPMWSKLMCARLSKVPST